MLIHSEPSTLIIPTFPQAYAYSINYVKKQINKKKNRTLYESYVNKTKLCVSQPPRSILCYSERILVHLLDTNPGVILYYCDSFVFYFLSTDWARHQERRRGSKKHIKYLL